MTSRHPPDAGRPAGAAALHLSRTSEWKNRTPGPLQAFWTEMIDPTDLSVVPGVVDAPAFEEFFLAEHERLFQALLLLSGSVSVTFEEQSPATAASGCRRWEFGTVERWEADT